MKTALVLSVIFFIAGCSRQPKRHESGDQPTAIGLYDSSKHFALTKRDVALDLLNRATRLDSNFYQAYFDKLPLLLGFKDYGRALECTGAMIRLRPLDPGAYLTRGLLYERIGDSARATMTFRKAITLYEAALDTIPPQSVRYPELLSDKAVCLILAGEEQPGRKILKNLFESAIDDRLRRSIEPLMDKSRGEIVQSAF